MKIAQLSLTLIHVTLFRISASETLCGLRERRSFILWLKAMVRSVLLYPPPQRYALLSANLSLATCQAHDQHACVTSMPRIKA